MKKKIILLIWVFFFCICLNSCRDPLEAYESGDFLYVYSYDSLNKKCISIMGLSDEGLDKETIVIPTSINNYPVKNFGERFALRTEGQIISDKLINLYVHNQVEKYINDGFYENLENVNVYCGYSYGNLQKYRYEFGFCSNFIVAQKEYYSCISYDIKLDKYYNQISFANVVYYLNDDTEDTFFVDDCDGTIVNVTPPNPIREGYKFNGWYKEKECINKWDFEKDIIPSKEYDVDGNYIFKETSLYACWEKE